jgi:hypothetical protein
MARESPGRITQQLAHLYFAILAFLLRQENIFSSPDRGAKDEQPRDAGNTGDFQLARFASRQYQRITS